LIKIIIKEEHFKWHLEAFASELFIFKRDLWRDVSSYGQCSMQDCEEKSQTKKREGMEY